MSPTAKIQEIEEDKKPVSSMETGGEEELMLLKKPWELQPELELEPEMDDRQQFLNLLINLLLEIEP